MKKSHWIAAALVLALAAGGALWWTQRGTAESQAWRTAPIERGPLQATVAATGAVNPVSQVVIGTQVSGQIKEVLVDFNAEVKAGQLIAVIDPETFEYRVRQAQADVDAAQAAVLTAQANTAASHAGVSRAQTDLAEAERTHARNQSLVAQGFIAQSEADRTRAAVNTAREALKSAQAQLGVTEAQVKSAQANVAQRQAALAQARVDLGRTRILSPVNGIVIKRAIERGQTVAASLQAPELFIIAQNLRDMQVDASIDEADVGRIRAGQKATFTVDAFPGQNFEGRVAQVRKAAQNVANVVTYVGVIAFSNPDGRLLPGMTANVRIVTDQREDVLKLPNAALRVRIPGVEPSAQTAQPAAPSDAPAARATGAEAFRARLVAELQLTPAQQQQVDAVYAEARPRFAQLRELADQERGKARERVMAEIRERVAALLTPQQQPKYAALVAEAAQAARGGPAARGRVYLLGADGKPRALSVRLGISDGSSTELRLAPDSPEAAELKQGTLVVTGTPAASSASGAARPAAGLRLPF